MNNIPDNLLKIEQPKETPPSTKEITQENTQTPLIRYFTVLDESTESYVLGYN